MYLIPEHLWVSIDNNAKILINLVNGNADLLQEEVALAVQNGLFGELPSGLCEQLTERKQIFVSRADYETFIKNFDDVLKRRTRDEVPNFLYVPTYDCNLSCYYCFEKAYEKTNPSWLAQGRGRIASFLNAVENIMRLTGHTDVLENNPGLIDIAITGGEPLLESNREEVELLLTCCADRGYTTSIITNGLTIARFIDVIDGCGVDAVQVTLDGSKEVHDLVRVSRSGSPTFDRILASIDLLSHHDVHTFVRINVTKKNIGSIAELGDVIDRYKKVTFYTHLMQQEGCFGYDNVVDEVEGLTYLRDLKSCNDRLKNLFVDYHGRTLVENVFGDGRFAPKIKQCSAMQNQFIFDYTGRVYKCWWGIGGDSYVVGTYSNRELNLDEAACVHYRSRTIFNIEKCKRCKFRYVCGGGCAGRLEIEEIDSGVTRCPDYEELLTYAIRERYFQRRDT